MSRDPRVDPKRGDVLRHAGFADVCVEAAVDGDGAIVARIGGALGWCNLDFWRGWAKTAEVIHAAD